MTDNLSKSSDVCSEISEEISAFIDGELAKEQLAKIYEHLLGCSFCRQNYEDMKKTQKALNNYFKRSTEELEIPEKTLEKDNIISKIIFIQRQKRLIYSAAALGLLAIVSYFSITLINFNQPEKEAFLKVKFTKEKSNLAPLPTASKDFIKELKNKDLQKKSSIETRFIKH